MMEVPGVAYLISLNLDPSIPNLDLLPVVDYKQRPPVLLLPMENGQYHTHCCMRGWSTPLGFHQSKELFSWAEAKAMTVLLVTAQSC